MILVSAYITHKAGNASLYEDEDFIMLSFLLRVIESQSKATINPEMMMMDS